VNRGARKIRGYLSDGHYYKVSVSYVGKFAPFRLKRKASRLHMEQKEDKLGIKSIEEIKNGDGVCFRVNHPSHQFVIQDFIVTHNSEAGLVWMVEPEYIRHQKYHGLVVRRNYDDLSDWIARAKLMYRPLRARFSGNPPVIKFPSGAFIRTGHLKDENAYMKYMGHEYQKMLIEELTQIPTELLYQQLVSACRSSIPDLPAQVFSTTNPGGPGHSWTKSYYVDKAYKETFYDTHEVSGRVVTRTRIFIPSRVWDTPQLYLNDPAYVVYLNSLPEDLRAAWRDGSWDSFVGQFFTEFSRGIHGVRPFKIPDEWRIFGGLDYGEAVPTSFGLYAYDETTDNVYRVAEYYRPGSAGDHVREIWRIIKYCEWTGGRKPDAIYADPSMWITRRHDAEATSRSAAQTFLDSDLPITPGVNNRVQGWWECKRRLHHKREEYGAPAVSPSFHYFLWQCTNFEKYLPGMIHVENGDPEDAKKKEHDHAADEFRYALMGLTEREDDEQKEEEDDDYIYPEERLYRMEQHRRTIDSGQFLERVFGGGR